MQIPTTASTDGRPKIEVLGVSCGQSGRAARVHDVAAYLRGLLCIILLLLFVFSTSQTQKTELWVIYQSLCHVSRLQD
jgi:hypothetical protein